MDGSKIVFVKCCLNSGGIAVGLTLGRPSRLRLQHSPQPTEWTSTVASNAWLCDCTAALTLSSPPAMRHKPPQGTAIHCKRIRENRWCRNNILSHPHISDETIRGRMTVWTEPVTEEEAFHLHSQLISALWSCSPNRWNVVAVKSPRGTGCCKEWPWHAVSVSTKQKWGKKMISIKAIMDIIFHVRLSFLLFRHIKVLHLVPTSFTNCLKPGDIHISN